MTVLDDDDDSRLLDSLVDGKLKYRRPEQIAFSPAFLRLQNRMLGTTAELSSMQDVSEKTVKEHAAQSAELSRSIAETGAEKARQSA